MPVDVAELSLLELQPFQVRAALLKAGLFRKAKSNTCLCKTVMMAMMMMMVMMTVTTTTIFRFFFLIIYLFIYFWLHWVFIARVGVTLRCSAQASHYSGFSCCGAWALGSWASVVVARRLSSCGTQA